MEDGKSDIAKRSEQKYFVHEDDQDSDFEPTPDSQIFDAVSSGSDDAGGSSVLATQSNFELLNQKNQLLID